MKTSIDSKPAEWTAEIREQWEHTYEARGGRAQAVPTSANYNTDDYWFDYTVVSDGMWTRVVKSQCRACKDKPIFNQSTWLCERCDKRSLELQDTRNAGMQRERDL